VANAACDSVTSATINMPLDGGYYSGTVNANWTPLDGTYDTCVFDVEYQRSGEVGWTNIGSTNVGETFYDWDTTVATSLKGDANDYLFRINK
jgi:hypothetical protein